MSIILIITNYLHYRNVTIAIQECSTTQIGQGSPSEGSMKVRTFGTQLSI